MSAILGLLFVTITLVIGYSLALGLLPGAGRPGSWDKLLALGLAPGLGAGVVSVASLFLMTASRLSGESSVASLLALGAVSILLALHATRRRRHADQAADIPEPLSPAEIPHARVLGLIGGLALLALIVWTVYRPYGGWDAWTFWNQRALFILNLGDGWRAAFDPAGAVVVDYPLLLPLTVLSGWLLAGGETVAVPIALAWVFTCGTVVLVVAATARLHSRIAYVVGAVTAGAPFFIRHGAHQYADVPLAYYLVATLALIALAIRSGSGSVWIAAGLSAGFAAWTKNEGTVFGGLVVLSLVLIFLAGPSRFTQYTSRKCAAFALAGVLPAALALLAYRVALPATNAVFQNRAAGAVLEQLVSMRNFWPTLIAVTSEILDPAHWAFLYPFVLVLFLAVLSPHILPQIPPQIPQVTM
jgi:hypothetical protein